MRESSTTQCAQFGHPEITVSFEEGRVLEDDVTDMLQTLSGMVAMGSSFRPGQTIQVGWLYGQFRQHANGHLTIYEPDLESFPVSWSEGVVRILMTKRLQMDVADSFGLREVVDFSTFCHSCVVCSEYSGDDDFIMSRWTPEGNASGWSICCQDPRHDHDDVENLRRLSTYELVTRISREPLMYLALPPEIVVRVTSGRPSAALGERELSVVPGSLLDALGRPAAV